MAEGQQEDFSKLSIEDKLGHKVWKARLMGYEEVTKLFKKIDDENSPEYSKYTGLVRKFPVESNAVAQEKALEATLSFTELAAAAGKICSEVIAGIVTKCLNARPKTKELGINICLMYIEIEKQDIVIEEIMKGFGNKQPKIVAASISVVRRALEEFGAKVFNIKALLKSVPGVFEHSDKNVRAEAKLLAIELFKWVGAALKATIDGKIKPVQMKELEDEFSKLPPTPPAPTRLLRSQQAVAQATPTGGETAGSGGLEGAVAMSQPEEIDPYDLLDPVNMLDKMPKDFYDRIVDTKWKERKEALEAILPLAQSPKLEPGDFGELIKVLRKEVEKMAEKHSDALQKLEEQLTCSICFGHLTNPKTLSCLHSFCHKCLEQLTSFSNEVKCPSCRTSFDLGESGVDNLPTAFLVNNLMEVHGMLKKVSSNKIVVCDICGESFASGYCQQCESFSCEKCLGFHNKWKKNATHSILTLQELAESAYNLPRAKSEVVMKCTGHNKPLDIYCETCEELICQHCTVRIHRDHSYDVVHDIYDTQREAIKTSIVPVDELIDKGEACTKALLAKKELLAEKGDKVKEDIQTRTSEIMDQLFVAADKLSREVDTAIIEEDSRIDEQIGEIKASLCQLSACKEYIEQSLSVGSPQQVLSSKTKLIKHTEGVVNTCDFSKFQEAEDFVVGLDRGIEMHQSAILKSIGKINSKLVTSVRVKSQSPDTWGGLHGLSLQEKKEPQIMLGDDIDKLDVPIKGSDCGFDLMPMALPNEPMLGDDIDKLDVPIKGSDCGVDLMPMALLNEPLESYELPHKPDVQSRSSSECDDDRNEY